MPSIKSRLTLVAILCLAATAAHAAGAAATGSPNGGATSATAAGATAGPLTPAQVDAVIKQNGFTPLGQPKQKGNIFGSLAVLGNNTFVVTVDAQTGQFLDAKPTSLALPGFGGGPAPATPAAAAATQPQTATTLAPAVVAPPVVVTTPAPVAVTAPAANAANNNVSPVQRAANLARSQGFKVISFKHSGDDTFVVVQRGDDFFTLKIDDKGRLLATAPLRRGDDD